MLIRDCLWQMFPMRWHRPVILDLGRPVKHSEPFAKRRPGRMRRMARLMRVAEKMQTIRT